MDIIDYYRKLVKTNNVEQLKKELELNPSIVHVMGDFGVKFDITLLMFAAQRKNVEITKLLIEFGSNINGYGETGNTPLMYAAFVGSLEIAKLLLERGASISDRNPHTKISALNHALRHEETKYRWIRFFEDYRDKLDQRDLDLWCENRLPSLFK